jgi:hypothetical protein
MAVVETLMSAFWEPSRGAAWGGGSGRYWFMVLHVSLPRQRARTPMMSDVGALEWHSVTSARVLGDIDFWLRWR